MTRILITSGPTRQYLDPVRFLSNASSGRMGAALATAAIEAGHEVIVVSGPVGIEYPAGVELINVVSTEEMAERCLECFGQCDGLIAAAAPCDYRPVRVATSKIAKTGEPHSLILEETRDIVAELAEVRAHQWMVAFALETEDLHSRALRKLRRKGCDLIVANGPQAIDAPTTEVQILDRQGIVLASPSGTKQAVATTILRLIAEQL